MLKKFMVIVLTLCMVSCGLAFADEDYVESEFEYTADGNVVKYYGGEYVYVPSELYGTTLLRIADNAFMDLGITGVSIEEGLIEIGKEAFSGSNITNISIPSTMENIKDGAFAYCAELEDVFIFGNKGMQFGENVFAGTGKITFYIACECDNGAFWERLKIAKGDDNYEIEVIHPNMSATDETDLFGATMGECDDCGITISQYDFDIYEPFDDVSEDSWYYKYVVFAYGMGIVNGKSETVFDPEGTMTCAEAAKIAASIRASQTTGEQIVPMGAKWYDAYVDYCYEMGIIEDYITFDWEKPITRGEMAYLFSRCDFYPYYINEVPLTDIPDVYDTTPYAYEILDLYDKGVATGDVDFSFHPDANVKRSEAAAFISRIIGYEMRIELPKG